MGIEYVEVIKDDRDGKTLTKDEAQKVTFSHDGETWTVYLSEANAEALADALKPFKNDKAKTTSAPSRTTRTASKGKRSDLAAIRAWANDNGYAVSDRGRVPTNVEEAYDKAHS